MANATLGTLTPAQLAAYQQMRAPAPVAQAPMPTPQAPMQPMQAPAQSVSASPMPQASPAQPNAFTAANSAYSSAQAAANRLANFRAPTISAPADISVGQVATTDMNPYMNPYMQQVIDQSMMDMDRARMMAMNDVGAQATQAGAFGGSRHGLVEAETNRNFADRAGALAAQLRQANFQNAQNMAQFDIGNQFSADQFNAGMDFDASRSNQNAALNAAQIRGGGVSALNTLGNSQFNAGLGLTNLQRQIGADQRGIQQQVLNNAMGQYGNTVNAPMQGLNMLTSVLSGMPRSSTTTQSSNPGLLGGLGMLAAL